MPLDRRWTCARSALPRLSAAAWPTVIPPNRRYPVRCKRRRFFRWGLNLSVRLAHRPEASRDFLGGVERSASNSPILRFCWSLLRPRSRAALQIFLRPPLPVRRCPALLRAPRRPRFPRLKFRISGYAQRKRVEEKDDETLLPQLSEREVPRPEVPPRLRSSSSDCRLFFPKICREFRSSKTTEYKKFWSPSKRVLQKNQ